MAGKLHDEGERSCRYIPRKSLRVAWQRYAQGNQHSLGIAPEPRLTADDADAKALQTAFHEAGHAVVAFFSPNFQVRRVTIVQEYTIPGSTEVKILGVDDYEGLVKLGDGPHVDIFQPRLPPDANEARLKQRLARIVINLAGPIAGWRGAPRNGCSPMEYLFGDDLTDVQRLAFGLRTFARNGMVAFLHDRWRDTVEGVTDRWPQIEAVALALLREKTLDRHRLREVILAC